MPDYLGDPESNYPPGMSSHDPHLMDELDNHEVERLEVE